MKKHFIIILFLIIFSSQLFSEYKKDAFAIVLIPNKEFLKIYEEPKNDSQIIEEIPGGFKNISVTWRTFNDEINYWIEIKYNNKKGWVNRNNLTRYFGSINNEQEKRIESLLINLTKSLQQKDYNIFKNVFYFIRGINIYNSKSKDIIKYEYKKYNILWDSLFEENNDNNTTFSQVLNVLESDFDIQYNIKSIKHSIPIEFRNFQYIILKNNVNTVYIGLEYWLKKPYISCICIF